MNYYNLIIMLKTDEITLSYTGFKTFDVFPTNDLYILCIRHLYDSSIVEAVL